MKQIDRETVQRIIDTADIVEVVSDFVSLKRRGANYIGLCPFHNERTPSFSVSKSKGICKCFSCGKGGSPVNFIMEIEQVGYQEALRYLAKKYNIEIKEREMSEAEKAEASQRESMLAVNQFAMSHFESNLTDTPDGREIGLTYFRQRGINDAMIKRFHLGYALEKSNEFYEAATRKGFKPEPLISTGLCSKSERGTIYDRFKGRVIYPVFGVSGKVVAFGGRTLKSDKTVAKYVNSPESSIYRKSYELYGLYQAKQAIAAKNKCILVEGYMDVISMHQSGVENVVASSGTSLTEGQIRLIHRFTENVTVIYDSDAAGVKASLRGIDLLLAEGLDVKVLSLPDGDDPDSYAQNHSSTELEEYLSTHETDFIKFKTSVLLRDAGDDPMKRSRVIADILKTIAVIPNEVTRTIYVAECSRMLGVPEDVLMLQLAKFITERLENESNRQRQKAARESIADIEKADSTVTETDTTAETVADIAPELVNNADNRLEKFEREIIRYVLKYGMAGFCSTDDGRTLSLIAYVKAELDAEAVSFSIPLYKKVFDTALELTARNWDKDYSSFIVSLDRAKAKMIEDGLDEIRSKAASVADATALETALRSRADNYYESSKANFTDEYIEKLLLSSPDDEIRRLTTDLVSEKYTLSKVHTKYTKIETERDRLIELVPRAIYALLDAILKASIDDIEKQLHEETDSSVITGLLQEYMEKQNIHQQFAKVLGERTITGKITRRF